MKRIHFVCRGDTYRSRLAEAYAKSLLVDNNNSSVSSSGIEAELDLHGDVSPETVKILKAEGIEKYLTEKWRQTTQRDIDRNDVVIFMSHPYTSRQPNTTIDLSRK